MVKSLKEHLVQKNPLTSVEIYGIIRAYLEEQIATAYREMLKRDSFDSPAWSEYHAFQLGNIKGLNKLLDFIPNLDQKA